ncbi:MAG: short-chain fatty acyl-CoA regulator family protein [Pseudomonadota bacterium]
MPMRALAGTRIRERRLSAGRAQADLARQVGISASYLNLIEHNRRRIGGKLILNIADALGVDSQILIEGAETALLNTMREAAASPEASEPEIDRMDEFAGRFPGWATLVGDQHRRIRDLERTVTILTDRLTHDPHLAASLHEMISTVTAIRSTSAILHDTQDIEPEWQRRFQRNIAEDSRRLAETSQSLVAYLDEAGRADSNFSAPQDEVDAFLEGAGYHFTALESVRPAAPETIVAGSIALTSQTARGLAVDWLTRYLADAKLLPLAQFERAAIEAGYDPGLLAQRFSCPVPQVFRRLATLPAGKEHPDIGLVVCDGSGTLVTRKAPPGLSLPKFGAACPLWPLYQALARPNMPTRSVIAVTGDRVRTFIAYAVSVVDAPMAFQGPQLFEASMLLLPEEHFDLPAQAALRVGTSCRICSENDCPARREPSILTDGF